MSLFQMIPNPLGTELHPRHLTPALKLVLRANPRAPLHEVMHQLELLYGVVDFEALRPRLDTLLEELRMEVLKNTQEPAPAPEIAPEKEE